MKPRTLRFVEQYIDEDPPTDPPRRWRGITGYVGDEWVIRMDFVPKKLRFDENDHFDFDTSLPGTDFRRKVHKKKVRSKEEAKEFAQEMFNEYVYSLCMDEANPNGGATTAELALELGSSLDEALDIHNEVERLATPEDRIKELKHLIELEMDPFAQLNLQKELDKLLSDED